MIVNPEQPIEDFIDNEFGTFIVHRFEERTPRFDGLIDVHRKILYAAFTWETKMKGKKRIAVSSLGSQTKIVTDYGKGEENINRVIKNECIKNLPLYKGEGSFGTRVEPEGGQARYIGVLFPSYIDALFPKLDNVYLVEYQYDEDQDRYVEPKSYNPLIPLLLVNGQQQIGVGFSNHVLPRSVKTIIDTLKAFTQGKKLNTQNWRIPIRIPHYKGEVTRVGAKKDRTWVLKGKYKWEGNTLWITEYRYDQNPYKYNEYLDELKGKGYIYSYASHSFVNTIKYEVKTLAKTRELTDKQLRKLFKLDGTVTENILEIEEVGGNSKLKIFTDETSYIKDWYYKRVEIVEQRRLWMINDYNHQIELLRSQIFYMMQVRDKEFDISKITMEKLLEYLDKTKEIIRDVDPNTKEDKGYEYITKLRITSMTKDNIERRKRKIKEYEDLRIELENTTKEKMYYDDLVNLEKELKKVGKYV